MKAIFSARQKRIRKRMIIVENGLAVIQCVGLLISLLTMYFKFFHQANCWTPPKVLGLLLFLISYMMWAIARIQLGNSFSIRPEARSLVTTGLYSKFSHPIYVFSSLAMTGYMIMIGKYSWLLIIVVALPVQYLRAGKENQVLQQQFGEEFDYYRRRVWF